MTKKTVAPATEVAAVAAVKAPVKGAKAAEKEATPAVVKAPKAPKAVKEPKPHVETKADKARAIFASMNATAPAARKDVIAAFTGLGLSNAAAATYYQNIKSKSAAAPVAAAKDEPAVASTEAAAE